MVDLSKADVSEDDKRLADLGLEEHAHRIGLQRQVFSFALAAACILLISAIVVAACSLHLYATKDKFDWHVILLLGAFVIPMTVIAVAAMRAAFRKDAQDHDETSMPSWDVIKDFIKEVAGAFKGSGS